MNTTSFSFPRALFPGRADGGPEAVNRPAVDSDMHVSPSLNSITLSLTPGNLHDRDKYRNEEGLSIDGVQQCDGEFNHFLRPSVAWPGCDDTEIPPTLGITVFYWLCDTYQLIKPHFNHVSTGRTLNVCLISLFELNSTSYCTTANPVCR